MNQRQRKKRNKRLKNDMYRETWALDLYIARYIHPRLVLFKKVSNCNPIDLTCEEWNTILDKMIKAFELLSIDRIDRNEANEKYINEGLDLFRKWYRNLWW